MSDDDGNVMPNYWAVLPAAVRYSRKLSSTAKLLYAEITSLTNLKGYCYASNAYFAKVFGVSESTVAHTISDIAKKGFLNVVLLRGVNSTIKERRIYLINAPLADFCKVNSPCKNLQEELSMQNSATDSLCKNLQGGIAKNCKENNKNLNKDNIYSAHTDPTPCGKTVENTKRFVKPTIDEVREYCAQRKNGIDPQYFFDYYESKGWMIGKNKMKDWRASVRTWEHNNARYCARRTGEQSQTQQEEERRDYEPCPKCGRTALWWSDGAQKYKCDACGVAMTYSEKARGIA